MTEIMQYSFSNGLLSIMSLRFIHVVTYIRISFFFMDIPLYVYVTFCSVIHLSMNIFTFSPLAIMNNPMFVSFVCISRSGIIGSYFNSV